MIDLHSKGAAFKRQVLADVAEMVRGMVSGISLSLATQQNGTRINDQHRTLNFQGSGVSLTDDPANRRTNIFIAGATDFSGNNTSIVSAAAAEKVYSLGTVANASGMTTPPPTSPPASWYTTAFADSGWSSSIALTFSESSFYTAAPGGAWVTAPVLDGNLGSTAAGFLFRRHFTLPAGTIQSATLYIQADDDFGVGIYPTNPPATGSIYLNGTDISSSLTRPNASPGAYGTGTVSASLLNAGGADNVLAAYIYSGGGGIGASYKLVVTYLGSITVTNELAADVSLAAANTYYTGPSVSLVPGQWLLVGAVAVLTAGTNSSYAAKLTDGTSLFGAADISLVAGHRGVLPVSGIVAPTVTTTYSIQVASGFTGNTMKASGADIDNPPKVSHLRAVKIG